MRTYVLAGMFLLFAFPASAETVPALPSSSLFFTVDETAAIDALARKAGASSDIHLGAVLYYGPDDWTVWLQNERWTPATSHNDLRIVKVAPGAVDLIWTPATDPAPHAISLQPYQTFRTGTGIIVEGER